MSPPGCWRKNSRWNVGKPVLVGINRGQRGDRSAVRPEPEGRGRVSCRPGPHDRCPCRPLFFGGGAIRPPRDFLCGRVICPAKVLFTPAGINLQNLPGVHRYAQKHPGELKRGSGGPSGPGGGQVGCREERAEDEVCEFKTGGRLLRPSWGTRGLCETGNRNPCFPVGPGRQARHAGESGVRTVPISRKSKHGRPRVPLLRHRESTVYRFARALRRKSGKSLKIRLKKC